MQINQYPTIKNISDGDLFVVQTASDGALKNIAASDLQAYFGSASGNAGTSTPGLPSTRSFVSPGDANGVFYYIGTSEAKVAWSNPCGIGVDIAASSVGAGSVEFLTDRTDNEFYTNSNPNSWVEVDFEGLALKCSGYTLQNRNRDGHYLRNWQLQGSADKGITWDILDNQVNNTVLNTPSQWLYLPITSSVAYSKFRIYETGINSSSFYYICLGEFEFYGILDSAT